jgi:hypothetical protein
VTSTASCLNCDAPLPVGQRFCGQCGQRVGRERLVMRDIAHDLLHAMFHVDHSIVSLLRALLTRPGVVAREYVRGRRKKYFGPFAFLMISVALASFVVVISGVQWIISDASSGPVQFLQLHVNLVVLAQAPLLAGLCALLFRDSRRNYAEHLVLAAYTSGFKILCLALVAVPAVSIVGVQSAEPWYTPIYLGLWLVYFSVAAVQFYRGRTLWVVARAVIVALVNQALTVGMVIAFITIFERMRNH